MLRKSQQGTFEEANQPALGASRWKKPPLSAPSLMDVAAVSLVFQTWPVISCDLEIQMFPGLDFTAQNNGFPSKMPLGTSLELSLFLMGWRDGKMQKLPSVP